MGDKLDTEHQSIAKVVRRLVDCHPGTSTADMESLVWSIHERFAHARIRDFVPLLVERSAREALARV
jgi:hypothetical protein